MTHKACSMQGCPNAVGAVPYKLFKSDLEFCSRKCINDFVDAKDGKKGSSVRECCVCGHLVRLDGAMRTRDGRVYHAACELPAEEEKMEVPAEDFGTSGITRKFCDRRGCGKQVTLCWKGRSGEYCSNQCLKISEKGKTEMETTETNATPVNAAPPSPIAAGASKKNAAKKAAKPAPAAKKTASPAKKTAPKAAPKAAKKTGGGAAALALMSRKTGATIDEIAAAGGWTVPSAQSFISNTRAKGVQIDAVKNKAGERRYIAHE